MLGEVSEYEVAAAPGQATLGSVPYVGGIERRRQPVVQRLEGPESLEALAVARRVGAPARDDVAAVGAVFTRRVQVLALPG